MLNSEKYIAYFKNLCFLLENQKQIVNNKAKCSTHNNYKILTQDKSSNKNERFRKEEPTGHISQ